MKKIGIGGFFMAGVTLALCQPAGAVGLLAIVNPAARAIPADKWEAVLDGQYFEASDYTSMRHYADDWRGSYTPRDGKNLAVAFARADVSARHESWSAGYFYRHDVLLESNRDMTDIVHANKTGTPVPLGRTYDFSLELNGFQVQGVRVDKGFTLKTNNSLDVFFGIGASLLNGRRMRMGQARGNALSTATGYTYDASLTDADSRKKFLYMSPGEVSGAGYALDLGLRLQWQNGKRLDFAINDLLGEIRWKNLPQTAMVANSATATHDAQGYIAFNPAMSGQNTRGNLTQKLDIKGSLQFHAPLAEEVSATLGMEWIRDNLFPRLGLEYAAARGIDVAADYDTRFKTIGIGAVWNGAYLAVRTQSLNFARSRGYGVDAGLAFKF